MSANTFKRVDTGMLYLPSGSNSKKKFVTMLLLPQRQSFPLESFSLKKVRSCQAVTSISSFSPISMFFNTLCHNKYQYIAQSNRKKSSTRTNLVTKMRRVYISGMKIVMKCEAFCSFRYTQTFHHIRGKKWHFFLFYYSLFVAGVLLVMPIAK